MASNSWPATPLASRAPVFWDLISEATRSHQLMSSTPPLWQLSQSFPQWASPKCKTRRSGIRCLIPRTCTLTLLTSRTITHHESSRLALKLGLPGVALLIKTSPSYKTLKELSKSNWLVFYTWKIKALNMRRRRLLKITKTLLSIKGQQPHWISHSSVREQLYRLKHTL